MKSEMEQIVKKKKKIVRHLMWCKCLNMPLKLPKFWLESEIKMYTIYNLSKICINTILYKSLFKLILSNILKSPLGGNNRTSLTKY